MPTQKPIETTIEIWRGELSRLLFSFEDGGRPDGKTGAVGTYRTIDQFVEKLLIQSHSDFIKEAREQWERKLYRNVKIQEEYWIRTKERNEDNKGADYKLAIRELEKVKDLYRFLDLSLSPKEEEKYELEKTQSTLVSKGRS